MSPKPPRAGARLVELFVSMSSAEAVLGDLAEEFAGRLSRSRHGAAGRWYWRQALRTTAHLVWGSAPGRAVVDGRARARQPRPGGGRRSCGRRAASLLLANVNAYDYVSALSFWRAVDVIRFVFVPDALGWSCATIARDREMVITALIAGVLIAVLAWNVGIRRPHLVPPGALGGSPGGRRFLYDIVQVGTTFPLSLVAGGMMRRIRQLRAIRSVR